MPFNSENQIETDQNFETQSEDSKAGDDLLLVRGTHFCCDNNRVEKLKQLLIGKPEKLIGLQALCCIYKIDVH